MASCGESYNKVEATRTSISEADTWTKIVIPIGSRFPLLGVEDQTLAFRVSVDNSIATSSGIGIPAGGSYQQEGVTTEELIIYVAVASLPSPTSAILLYTQD